MIIRFWTWASVRYHHCVGFSYFSKFYLFIRLIFFKGFYTRRKQYLLGKCVCSKYLVILYAWSLHYYGSNFKMRIAHISVFNALPYFYSNMWYVVIVFSILSFILVYCDVFYSDIIIRNVLYCNRNSILIIYHVRLTLIFNENVIGMPTSERNTPTSFNFAVIFPPIACNEN